MFVYTKDRTQNTDVWVAENAWRKFHLSRRTDIRVVGGKLRKEIKSEKRELCISVFFLITWLYPEATLFSLSLFFPFVSLITISFSKTSTRIKRDREKTSVDNRPLWCRRTQKSAEFLVSGTQEKRPQSLSFSSHMRILITDRSSNTWENICWLHNDLKLRSCLKEKDFFTRNFFNFWPKTFVDSWLNVIDKLTNLFY